MRELTIGLDSDQWEYVKRLSCGDEEKMSDTMLLLVDHRMAMDQRIGGVGGLADGLSRGQWFKPLASLFLACRRVFGDSGSSIRTLLDACGERAGAGRWALVEAGVHARFTALAAGTGRLEVAVSGKVLVAGLGIVAEKSGLKILRLAGLIRPFTFRVVDGRGGVSVTRGWHIAQEVLDWAAANVPAGTG